MIKLYVDDAISLVRKNMDEVDSGTAAMLVEPSATAMDEVISRSIPEAVNIVNRKAPVSMLEGVTIPNIRKELVTLHGMYITRLSPVSSLRLLRLKASDSDYIVTTTVPADSPEGHMQLNPHTCGRSDHPVVVEYPDGTYDYYSHDNNQGTVPTAYHMPVCELEQGELYGVDVSPARKYYYVSAKVKEDIVRTLTALVLTVYGQTDKAKIFMNAVGND